MGNLSYFLNNIKWIFIISSILSISINKGYNSTAINIGEYILYNIFLYLREAKLDKIYKKSIIIKNKKIISVNKKAYEILNFFDEENIKKSQEKAWIFFNERMI